MINFFYNIITKFYSLLFSTLENFFYGKKKKNSTIKPFIRFQNIIIKDLNYKKFDKIIQNKYLVKYIFPENEIRSIIDQIFIKNQLSKKISNVTGFNYSINFFTAYKTYKILSDDLDKKWYANHFHIDKPYSKNLVKIFFSFEQIDENKGPMIIKDDKIYFATLKKNEVFLFFANKFYHKASSPTKNDRFQMMLQLTPSKSWCVNEDIFNKQNKIEPKFPFFSYFFDKKIDLNI